MEGDPSIVEYFAEHEGYRCGYCKSKDTNFSHGMWAHQMHVQDYQDLIDRGWRRSGKYCYKPTMNRTCCPMYTIKCDAVDFKLSKSQKKVIKRVNRFLITGKRESGENEDKRGDGQSNLDERMSGEGDVKNMESMLASKIKTPPIDLSTEKPEIDKHPNENLKTASEHKSTGASSSSSIPEKTTKKDLPRPGSGADPSKPPCRKAKDVRAERKQQKLATNPKDKVSKQAPVPKNTQKTLEDLLNEPDHASNCAHKMEIRLCRTSPQSEAFLTSLKDSHPVFCSYQMAIHGDSSEECNIGSFKNFLVDSPLQELHEEGGPSMGYGSFHLQYLLDGQIITVGVIDILPSCISSVYLYYDPGYSFLNLGMYSALREIALVRELANKTPALRHYYLGFYIHSCVKMRYKGQFSPSFLACPETYNWIPLEKCRPILDRVKYARFEKDGEEDKNKVEDINKILVLHRRTAMPYEVYTALTKGKNADGTEVKEYANFVGKTCAERMLLVRK